VIASATVAPPGSRVAARTQPVAPSAATTSIRRSPSDPTAHPVLARIRLPPSRTTVPHCRLSSARKRSCPPNPG
jgi:hypothetical protein